MLSSKERRCNSTKFKASFACAERAKAAKRTLDRRHDDQVSNSCYAPVLSHPIRASRNAFLCDDPHSGRPGH